MEELKIKDEFLKLGQALQSFPGLLPPVLMPRS